MFFSRLRRAAALVLIIFTGNTLAATDPDAIGDMLKGNSAEKGIRAGSVYVYGDQATDVLVPVKVLGAVQNAGIYHIPPNTDLITLISLAGGTTDKALLEEVSIKRKLGTKEEVISVNLQATVQETNTTSPVLLANDTVMIPVDKNAISDNTLRLFTIITGTATVVSSLIIGFTALKKE